MQILTAMAEPLVTCDWLHKNLSNPHVKILDVSLYLKDPSSKPFEEYKEEHIGGAIYFDIRECNDKASKYHFALPQPEYFEKKISSLGISHVDHVVLYEKRPNAFEAAPRLWTLFHLMGNDNVSILNGGFTSWKSKNFPTSVVIPDITPATYVSKMRPELIATIEDMRKNLLQKEFLHVDVRPKKQFTGEESFKSFQSGHLKGSINVPVQDLLDPSTNCLVSTGEIRSNLKALGIDESTPVTCSCNTGFAASTGLFILYCMGNKGARLFPDGMQGIKEYLLDHVEKDG